MKTTRLFFLVPAMLVILSTGCQKKDNGGNGEQTLAVTTSPVSTNNNVEAPAPGPTFPLKVTITSTMPSGGVKIDVAVHPDGSSTNFFTESRNSSSADNNFTITNTPRTVICVTQITVTSVSNTSNKWTGSYRYSSK